MLRSLASARQAARSPRGLARVLALAAALLHLGATLHSAHTRHVTCEHGEQVDVETSQSDDSFPHQGREERNWGAASSGATGHGHEHCFLTSFRRSPSPGIGASEVAPCRTGVFAISSAPCDEPRITGVPLYRLAPKCSPPA